MRTYLVFSDDLILVIIPVTELSRRRMSMTYKDIYVSDKQHDLRATYTLLRH